MKELKLKRILIANRGEIALRVIRAARDLGMESVAVFSDADQHSLHVKQADYAIRLPGNTAAETYLNIPSLIAAVKTSNADGVHPGYGFLSENFHFAEEVIKAGAAFVGPPPSAMKLMGDKVEAKRLMKQHKVPTVPGSEEALKSVADLEKHAKEIGFPMILKAAAGGGGRGMRVVRQMSDLKDAFEACTREATSYFGNPAVFCERYIENPRHIEFQVLFDAHGNGVHLFERDCSIQRRHQKLVEEAPSIYLSSEQRAKVGNFAVTAAKAAGYQSAGTIEFICESPEKIYFMEMNTRIQVEHTVTEEISGVDLVRQQLLVACGQKLPFTQEDIKCRGWAIEVRINAEDPAKEFTPAPGLIQHLRFPNGPGIRIDSHLYEGYTIPEFYDSMVAKLIVTGATRTEAIERTLRALAELEISGVPTTAKFHEAVLRHDKFRKGDFTTRFIEENYTNLVASSTETNSEDISALIAAFLVQMKNSSSAPTTTTEQVISKWMIHARRESV